MRKTISIIVIILLIAIGAYLYFSGTFDNDTNKHHAENQTGNPEQNNGKKDKHEDGKGDNDESANNENEDETGQGDMNLDEKIGQMIFSGVDGTEMTADTEEVISTYHVGGIILFANN